MGLLIGLCGRVANISPPEMKNDLPFAESFLRPTKPQWSRFYAVSIPLVKGHLSEDVSNRGRVSEIGLNRDLYRKPFFYQ